MEENLYPNMNDFLDIYENFQDHMEIIQSYISNDISIDVDFLESDDENSINTYIGSDDDGSMVEETLDLNDLSKKMVIKNGQIKIISLLRNNFDFIMRINYLKNNTFSINRKFFIFGRENFIYIFF